MKKIAFYTALSMMVSHTALAAGTYVNGININGLERVEPETVLSYIEVKKGEIGRAHV